MSTSESKSSKSIEDVSALKPIALEEKKPWTYHAAAWAGVVFVLAAFMGGATPIAFLPYGYAVVTILIGNLILFSIFTLTSYMGAKTGLNTYMIAKSAFGDYGSRILINIASSGIPAFAWYGIETWLAAAAISVLLGWDIGGPGRLMDLPTAIFTIISGILMAIPPVFGITSIALIDYISIPIMIMLVAYGLYLGISVGITGGLFTYSPPGATPETLLPNFMIAMNVVIGLIIVGATIGSDTARWIRPNKKEVVLACVLGFLATAIFMEIIGTFFAVAAIKAGLDPSLSWNIVLVLKSLGVATGPLWPLLVMAFLLQFTTNMINAYSGGLAWTVSVGKPQLRAWFTMGGAIVGSIIAVIGIVWYWVPYLNILANWVGPIASILLVEFYLIRKAPTTVITDKIPKIRIEGIIGWFLGGLTSYYLSTYAPYFIPTLIGMIVAGLIHIIGHIIRK
jgi:cytosine permease